MPFIPISIKGTVTNEQGAPICDAVVRLRSTTGEPVAEESTNSEGCFYIRVTVQVGFRPEQYRLEVLYPGFSEAWKSLEVDQGMAGRTVELTFQLSTKMTIQHKLERIRPPQVHITYEASEPPAAPSKTELPASASPVEADSGIEMIPPPIEEEALLQEEYAVVRIFYATDRITTGNTKPGKIYGSDRSSDGQTSFGMCDVSIPRDHRIGALEAPSILKLQFREDPIKHVVLLSVIPQPEAEFYRQLSGRVEVSAKKEAFVFIHGFNVTFEDAARRTAQMAYDLAFDGAPIFYSWPSKGKLQSYTVDETNVEWTVPHLEQFLRSLAANSGATTIHLIAHSMGNRALTNALHELAMRSAAPSFSQVILTAPDIDAEIFRQLAAAFQGIADRFTLYVSSRDIALQASHRIHGYPRAGDSDNPVIVPGVDTVDVSQVDTNFLGHFYYGDNRSVIADIFQLIRTGASPANRFGMLKILLGPLIYWAFRP